MICLMFILILWLIYFVAMICLIFILILFLMCLCYYQNNQYYHHWLDPGSQDQRATRADEADKSCDTEDTYYTGDAEQTYDAHFCEVDDAASPESLPV